MSETTQQPTNTDGGTALVPSAETVIVDKPTGDDARTLDVMAKIRAQMERGNADKGQDVKEPNEEREHGDVPDEVTDEAKAEPAKDTDQAEAKKPLAERLAERLAARKEKERAKSDYSQLKQQLQEQQQQLQEQQQQFYSQAQRMQQEFYAQREQFERERQQWLREVASNPIKLVTEHGYSADDIIRNIQLSDDPTYQATQRAQTELQQLKAQYERDRQEREQAQRAEQERMQAWHQEQAQRAHQQAVHALLNVHATPEKTPALRHLYDDWEIVERAQRTAEEYQKRTGEVANLEEIVEYEEQLAQSRLDALRGSTGKPAQAKGTGPRTLTPASASERRATPRSTKDMSEEEQQEHLLAKMAALRAGRTA